MNTTTPAVNLVNVGLLLQTFIRDVCDPSQVSSIDWWQGVNDHTDINIYGEDDFISVCAYELDGNGQQTGDYTLLAHFHVASVGVVTGDRWDRSE